MAYCKKFPTQLCRPSPALNRLICPLEPVVLDRRFKYDEKIEEYFVQTNDTEILRRAELEEVTKVDTLEATGLIAHTCISNRST